jgi:hypothetical protein
MRTARSLVLGSIVLCGGIVGGALGARFLGPSDARADDRPTTSTIYVGDQGLVFRNHSGRAIARLKSDMNGGVLEIFDASEQPRTRLRTTGLEVSMPSSPVPLQPLPVAPPPPPVTPPPPPPRAHATVDPRVDLGF